jgi:hypothetical protein
MTKAGSAGVGVMAAGREAKKMTNDEIPNDERSPKSE